LLLGAKQLSMFDESTCKRDGELSPVENRYHYENIVSRETIEIGWHHD